MSGSDYNPIILVIEDDRCNRNLLEIILEMKGYQIITAEDGIEGLAAFEQYAPDVIVTDIKMPRMDGLEFIRRVRGAGGPPAQTPIIVLTASSEDIIDQAQTAGATIVGRKPGDVRRVPCFIEEIFESNEVVFEKRAV